MLIVETTVTTVTTVTTYPRVNTFVEAIAGCTCRMIDLGCACDWYMITCSSIRCDSLRPRPRPRLDLMVREFQNCTCYRTVYIARVRNIEDDDDA
jgi:hypothetical protein